MLKKIELIRSKIDKIDDKIFDLIEKRLEQVTKIGKIKNKKKIPCYIKERENDMLNLKIINNNRKNVSNNLIKDILKRIISESYIIENKNFLYKNIYKNKNILFITKYKEISNIIKKIFYKLNYNNIYDFNIENKNNISKILLKKIDLIIIDDYNYKNIDFLNNLFKIINKKCIIIDLSFDKNLSIKFIKENFKNPILGLYPMFEYNENEILIKKNILVNNIKFEEKYDWIIKDFEFLGINLIYSDYKDQNNYLINIKILKYVMNLTYFSFIKNKNININKILKYFSKNDKLYFSNINNLLKKSNIYLNFIETNKKNIKILDEFNNHYKKIINYFKNNKFEEILFLLKKTKEFIKNNNNNDKN